MPRHYLGRCAVSAAFVFTAILAAEPSFAQRGGNPSGQVPGGRGGAPPPPPQAPPNPGAQRPAGTAPAREPGRGAVAAPIPDARYVRERMMDRKNDAADKCGPPGVSPTPDRFDWDAWWETGAPAPSRAAARGGADAARTAAEVIRRLIADPDPIVVEAAIESLGAVAQDEDAAKLVAIATGPDASLRFAAAIGLAASDRSAAPTALRERLLDPREAAAVRGAAALGLGALGDATSAPERSAIATNVDATLDLRVAALLGLGMSRDVAAPRAVLADAKAKPAVRCAAAVALGKSADPSAPVVEALVAALEAGEKEPDVRGAAAAALGALARRAGREKLGPARDRATAALARVGATDESIPVRGLATIALGEVDGKGARDALNRALKPKNDNLDVRAAAALGLGLAGDAANAPALVALLRAGEEEALAAAAATALGLLRLRDSSAVGALVRAVETDARPWVRAAAAEALGRIGAAEATAALEKRVKGYAEDPDAALAAVVALGRIGEAPALEIVRRAAVDRSNAILAARALAALGESGGGADVPLLATTAQDDAAPSPVRAAAVRAIARLGSKSEPVVERILSDTAAIPLTETLDVLSALR